jgi:hypothetical protein
MTFAAASTLTLGILLAATEALAGPPSPMNRQAAEVEAEIGALVGCPPPANLSAHCGVSVFANPSNGTVDTVSIELSLDRDPRQRSAVDQVIAIVRYLLPTWRGESRWLARVLDDFGRRRAKQAVRVDDVTVAVVRRESSYEDDQDDVDLIVTKGMPLDDPLVRGVSPRWRTIESLRAASDRTIAQRELTETGPCDGIGDTMTEICANRVRAGLVALPGGSNLLVVRYPNATTCAYGYSVFGPADQQGRRALTVRFLCARDFEVVRRDGERAWPDLRLTEYLRCDRDERGEMVHCWDAIFRWDGAVWDFGRRVEDRPDGLWRLGPATPANPPSSPE